MGVVLGLHLTLHQSSEQRAGKSC